MNKIQFTKVSVNYTHPSGVTIVKVNPAATRYSVLTPGKPVASFGSFAAAQAFGRRAVLALQAS